MTNYGHTKPDILLASRPLKSVGFEIMKEVLAKFGKCNHEFNPSKTNFFLRYRNLLRREFLDSIILYYNFRDELSTEI